MQNPSSKRFSEHLSQQDFITKAAMVIKETYVTTVTIKTSQCIVPK